MTREEYAKGLRQAIDLVQEHIVKTGGMAEGVAFALMAAAAEVTLEMRFKASPPPEETPDGVC